MLDWLQNLQYEVQMMSAKTNLIIAVDFDGTLCHGNWPDVGEPNRKLIDKLLRLQRRGNKIILWTCREGDALFKAIEASYERVINNVADEHGFRQYDFYLNNPNTKLTIEEFDRDNEIFVEVEPKLLWAELEKKSVYGKGPFFLLVTADEWNHDDDRWLGIYVGKNEAKVIVLKVRCAYEN